MPSLPPENSVPPSPLELLEASPPTREMWAMFVEIVEELRAFYIETDNFQKGFPMNFPIMYEEGTPFSKDSHKCKASLQISGIVTPRESPPQCVLTLRIMDQRSSQELSRLQVVYLIRDNHFEVTQAPEEGLSTHQLGDLVHSLRFWANVKGDHHPQVLNVIDRFEAAVIKQEHGQLLKLSTELMAWLEYLRERASSTEAVKSLDSALETEQFRVDYLRPYADTRISLGQARIMLERIEDAIRDAKCSFPEDDDIFDPSSIVHYFPKIREALYRLRQTISRCENEFFSLKSRFDSLKEAFNALPKSRDIPTSPDEQKLLLDRTKKLREEAKALYEVLEEFFSNRIRSPHGLKTTVYDYERSCKILYSSNEKARDRAIMLRSLMAILATLLGLGMVIAKVNLHLSPRVRAQHALLEGGVPTDISLRPPSYAPVNKYGWPIHREYLQVTAIWSNSSSNTPVKSLWRLYEPACNLDDHTLPYGAYDYLNYDAPTTATSPFVFMEGYEDVNSPRFNAMSIVPLHWLMPSSVIDPRIDLPSGFRDRYGKVENITVTAWGCPVFSAAVTPGDLIYSSSEGQIGVGVWVDLNRLNENTSFLRLRVYPSLLPQDDCVYWFEEDDTWNEGEWLDEFIDSFKGDVWNEAEGLDYFTQINP